MYSFLPLLLTTLFLQTVLCQNDRPIIGILSQRMPDSWAEKLGVTGTYIAGSYVKWVESSGARAVPLIVNGDQDTIELFNSINGVLIPGGAVSISDSDYANYGSFLVAMAMNANDFGDYFPVWGTCLGFEFLALVTNNFDRNLARCEASNVAMPLNFTEYLADSRLFKQADQETLDILSTEDVTANFHHWCLTMQNFTKFEMENFWNVISLNTDTEGMEFISTMEAKNYPFYATQFHPEKNSFEWAPSRADGIPHSKSAIKAGGYFGDFLVNEARKSSHKFESSEKESTALIYNYTPVFMGLDFAFQQIYVFPDQQ